MAYCSRGASDTREFPKTFQSTQSSQEGNVSVLVVQEH